MADGKSQGGQKRLTDEEVRMMPHTICCRRIWFGWLVGLVLPAISVLAQDESEPFQMIQTAPGLSLHKELFMLPVTYSEEYHAAQTEAVFQISAKHRIFNTPVYFAYTQISFWQAYDVNNSAPFRETNYNPELFWRTKRFPFWSGQAGADIGFEHESNGQRPPVSRSWNLFYACPYYYQDDLLLYLKLRYRFPEDDKPFPGSPLGDDNPDITDFLGYSDLHFYFRAPWKHLVHLMVRGNMDTGKGGVVFSYSVPLPRSGMSYVIVRVSQGFGESMVDYKKELTRVGVGIMFSH